MSDTAQLVVLCAGDRFITPLALAEAVRAEAAAVGVDVRTLEHLSNWPDEPFRAVDGVDEAAGDPRELAAVAGDADAIVTHLAPVSGTVLAAAPRLRVVGVTRGGPVNVDLSAAAERGVEVVNLPGRNLGAVAEYTLGLMIAVTRSTVPAARRLRAGEWDAGWFAFDRVGPELSASTVGIVGLGAVGRRVAELVGAFGARVVAYDPHVDPSAAGGTELVDLPELLGRSDIVSVHARLTDSTRRMIDAAALAAMKPGAYLVNTARGELVDTDALRAALESGHLRGAALDVFDPEPPAPDDPLLARPDVVATPHLAGASREVATRSAARIASEVVQRLAPVPVPSAP